MPQRTRAKESMFCRILRIILHTPVLCPLLPFREQFVRDRYLGCSVRKVSVTIVHNIHSPSGEPSSKPKYAESGSVRKYAVTVLTVTVLADAMRRGICNENDHLACGRSPFHIEGFSQGSRYGLWAVSSSRRVQGFQVIVNSFDIR